MLKITGKGAKYFEAKGYNFPEGSEITIIEAEDWMKNGDTGCHVTPLGLFTGTTRIASAF